MPRLPWGKILASLGVLIAAAVAIAAGIYLIFWPLSDLVAGHDVGAITASHLPARLRARDAALRAARDAARGRLLTFAAGLFAAGALIYTARNFSLSREGQVTDRYTRAIDQLGSENRDVTIGGIYALGRIAFDSAKDHPAVMEVLSAFVRDFQEPGPPSANDEPGAAAPKRMTRPEVQAALTVIGGRKTRHDRQRVNLTGANLIRTVLAEARLTRTVLAEANLTSADLTHANLNRANLNHANLNHANLNRANLNRANLTDADLTDADLSRAKLTYAKLSRAKFTRANLTGAVLTGAVQVGLDLTDADLTRANLMFVDLPGANLTHVNLTNARIFADLTHADLTGANLTGANLNRTRLTGANLTGANLTRTKVTRANLTDAIWPTDAAIPKGWQQDTESGRLRRGGKNSGGAPTDPAPAA